MSAIQRHPSFFVVLYSIALLLIGVAVGYIAHGENYNYTMSESELKDEWITKACIKLQINSPDCDMVYGGIMDHPSAGTLP